MPLHSLEEWLQAIASFHIQLQGKSPLEGKMFFMEAIQNIPVYGCTLFTVQVRQIVRVALMILVVHWKLASSRAYIFGCLLSRNWIPAQE